MVHSAAKPQESVLTTEITEPHGKIRLGFPFRVFPFY